MKKKLPKRLCRDPQTRYCTGKWGHRGCCECYEYNSGDWNNDCNPYLLPEEMTELKQWWLDNDMGPWEDSSNNHWRPKMKNRGGKK